MARVSDPGSASESVQNLLKVLFLLNDQQFLHVIV